MTTKRSRSLTDSSRSQKHGAVTVVDRISDLPDSILSHILSFLPTKDAVATTILSKRWDLLWATTVNLDFYCPYECEYREGRFAEFVNYVLLLHKPGYLNRFSLKWTDHCSHSCVNIWITVVVAMNVRELFIYVDIAEIPIRVQTRMFSCESLRSLELYCRSCISNEIAVSLPRLESLTLKGVYFEGEKAFCKLLDGCPILKCLVIRMDFGKMIHDVGVDGIAFKFIISSASLQHLELYISEYEYDYDYDYNFLSFLPTHGATCLCGVLQLDAPSLPYIKLIDSRYCSLFLQKRLIFLGEAANFQLRSLRHELKDCDSFVEAFHAFGCAKTLILSDSVIRNLSCARIKMTTRFNRLTRLEVLINWKYWSSLKDLIELLDNLQVLIVNKDDKVIFDDYLTNSKWKTPDIVPTCLSNSLRTVSIGAYNDHQNALAMVGYILKHGSVLQVMEVCFDESINDIKAKFEMVTKISKFPRKSPGCELEFC